RARVSLFVFFFFQAEDGIRDFHVTGVQTCALPISATDGILGANGSIRTRSEGLQKTVDTLQSQYDSTKESIEATMSIYRAQFTRSEERRVGKECRSRRSPDQ